MNRTRTENTTGSERVVIKVKQGRYRVLTGRHLYIAIVILLLAAIAIVLAAALIPYVYTAVTNAGSTPLPVCCTDRADNVISLTFDVTQGDRSTDKILSILNDYQVTATLFVTGEWADKYPDSVTALRQGGQEIMNGSDEYVRLSDTPRSHMIQQINTGADKLQALTGRRPTLFRAPYGEYSHELLETVKMLNMVAVGFDVDGFDDKGLSADLIIKRVVSQSTSGSIICLHMDGDHTVEALPKIIGQLKAKGFRFIPVSQMIYTDKYTLNWQGRQISSSNVS